MRHASEANGRRWCAFWWLVLIWLGLRLLWAVPELASRAPAKWSEIRHVFEKAPEQRIEGATGIGPEVVRAIRENLPRDGVLAIYAPETGRLEDQFLFDLQWERYRNLMFPEPPAIERLRGEEQLRAWLGPEMAGRLVLLDYSPSADPPLGGPFRLVGTGRFVRIWLLEPG